MQNLFYSKIIIELYPNNITLAKNSIPLHIFKFEKKVNLIWHS